MKGRWLRVELPEGVSATKVYKKYAKKYWNGKWLDFGVVDGKYLLIREEDIDFIQFLADKYGIVVIS